jgi:hypothetical protein
MSEDLPGDDPLELQRRREEWDRTLAAKWKKQRSRQTDLERELDSLRKKDRPPTEAWMPANDPGRVDYGALVFKHAMLAGTVREADLHFSPEQLAAIDRETVKALALMLRLHERLGIDLEGVEAQYRMRMAGALKEMRERLAMPPTSSDQVEAAARFVAPHFDLAPKLLANRFNKNKRKRP